MATVGGDRWEVCRIALAARVDRAYLRVDACVRTRSSVVAATRERKASLHAVSAPVRDSRGQGRVLLHPQERRRPAAEPRLWQIDRVRGRSGREEAAEPLSCREPWCSRSARPGCNLGCKFCQNWDISKARIDERRSEEGSPEEIVALALRSGCSGIAYTYNDPVIWAEYAIDIAAAAREAGLKNVFVSAGYVTAEARPEIYPLHGRDQHRSQGVHRGLLSPRHVVAPRAGARNARMVAARERRLAGDHHAADPWTQRLRPGDRRGVRVDRGGARAGRSRCTSPRSTRTSR